jgi:hypothetical protein
MEHHYLLLNPRANNEYDFRDCTNNNQLAPPSTDNLEYYTDIFSNFGTRLNRQCFFCKHRVSYLHC